MAWEFAEGNMLGNSSGSFSANLKVVKNFFPALPQNVDKETGKAFNMDAGTQILSKNKVISTDPPYYDNVPYADISDFFYLWLRVSLNKSFPDLFKTISTPKDDELVAFAYRHESKEKAAEFFMNGMTKALKNLSKESHPAFPTTIYYAFKQSDVKGKDAISTGWETFLQAVINAGFSIVGTWPMRTELNAALKTNLNSLASSIILVCKVMDTKLAEISRRDFQRELREKLPEALETMIGGETGQTPIAPVDLAQSAIGPGMAIFSKYSTVLNQDGSKMNVHDALILINREISDFLSPDSGGFDADTLFCSAWFEQYGWAAGQFGEAQVLAQAKGTTVDGVKEAGVIESGGGKVRLYKWAEYPSDWDPLKDNRTPIWEACHHMIRKLNKQGETEAGALLARMPEKGEVIRQLAYHLYTLCERKKWAEEARSYNELISAWSDIVTASHDVGHRESQAELDLMTG